MNAPIQATKSNKSTTDIVVLGAGLIGLAIALEMHGRGARVTVVERNQSLKQASIAAAGMLAVNDPHNPVELLPLSRLSAKLYPAFLLQVERLSGLPVPFQTELTFQYGNEKQTVSLAEQSIDPRQLAGALEAAVRATSITLLEHTEVVSVEEGATGMRLRTASGLEILSETVLWATGAWTSLMQQGSLSVAAAAIAPRKGQMLRVRLPEARMLREVHRSEHVYVVPRTAGPQAGSALIGATVEDAGFDTTVHAKDLARLRRLGAELVPEIASQADAPLVEAWAGLRPATTDSLPLFGLLKGSSRQFIATGHYRNGVLLAPATVAVMADLISRKTPAVDLSAFSPERFLL